MADRAAAGSAGCIPARYIFTIMVSLGLAILYGLKVNLSVAIVAMINNTELALGASHGGHSAESVCPVAAPSENGTRPVAEDGPFAWPESVQGIVLGSYFWGYIFTQLPGGRIAEMFSAKWVIWMAVFVNGLMTVITPDSAYLSYYALLTVRFIEGLAAGVSLPAIHVMLSKWAPAEERNRISSLAYAGMAVGTVISLPFTGFLADFWGWESVFYVQGGLSMIWCLAWVFAVYDSPKQHPRISQDELALFVKEGEGSSGLQHKKLPVPWKAVATSVPFWAIVVTHTCSNFGWYMLLVELPTYMKHIGFNISENSVLSALPYLCLFIFSVIWSNCLDWAKSRGWLTTVSVRKISTAVGSLIPGICLVGVTFAGCDKNAVVALMTVSTMCMAGMYCGFLSNHIDIAPNYAGTLMALTNTVGTVPGFLVPIFVGELTEGNQSLDSWSIVFWTTAAVFLLEFITFTIFGSGQEQTWNSMYTGSPNKTAGQQSEEEIKLKEPV